MTGKLLGIPWYYEDIKEKKIIYSAVLGTDVNGYTPMSESYNSTDIIIPM